MEKQKYTKKRWGNRNWTITAVLCGALALVLLIGYNGFNWRGTSNPLQGQADTNPLPTSTGTDSTPTNELNLSQEMIYFPSSDIDDGQQIPIPLHTTLAQLSVDSGDGPINTDVPPVPTMSFALTQKMEDQIEVTRVYRPDVGGGYLLLAPVGWQAAAVVGANGSYGVTFQDPNNPEQNLHYSDNAWGCGGCAISGIGTYFPEKANWADEMGFTIYEPLEFIEQHTLGSVGSEARTVRYTLTTDSNGYQTEGAAYYEEGEWGYLFRKMEIHLSVDSPQQELVETIMKFFTTNHGPLSIPAETESADSTFKPSF